jgi:hypothetical protein
LENKATATATVRIRVSLENIQFQLPGGDVDIVKILFTPQTELTLHENNNDSELVIRLA